MVVVGPVRDRPERGAGREQLGAAEHRHEGDEATVGAAVDADPLPVDAVPGDQVVDAVGQVLDLGSAHLAVDRRAPVAAVAGGGAEVHVEHDVASAGEQGVEHELPEVGGPALVGILEVAGAVHENDGGSWSFRGVGRHVEAGVDRAFDVRRGHLDEAGRDPVDGEELGRHRFGQPDGLAARRGLLEPEFGRPGGGGMDDQEMAIVRREPEGVEPAERGDLFDRAGG